jgi:hypothetical protein
MILQNEEGKPFVIDDIKTTPAYNYVWCLDLKEQDYILSNIKILEENTCSTITLMVNGTTFKMPAYWYILVCDPETTQLDAVQASTLSNNIFYALVYGASTNQPSFLPIHVLNWEAEEVNVYPSTTRNLMLCHDVGDGKWVSISFSDTYNRFLKDTTANNLVNY